MHFAPQNVTISSTGGGGGGGEGYLPFPLHAFTWWCPELGPPYFFSQTEGYNAKKRIFASLGPLLHLWSRLAGPHFLQNLNLS